MVDIKLCHGQLTEHSSTAPLKRAFEWEELGKQPHQNNFKSRIRDFRFCNLTVDARFFFHNALFIFFYINPPPFSNLLVVGLRS